jgi:hypothetical protein
LGNFLVKIVAAERRYEPTAYWYGVIDGHVEAVQLGLSEIGVLKIGVDLHFNVLNRLTVETLVDGQQNFCVHCRVA